MSLPEKMKVEISKFFPSCPLCQKQSIEIRWNADWYGRDYLVCSNCDAKWHIYYLGSLKWAKLIEEGTSGLGAAYLEEEKNPTFWFNMIEKTSEKSLKKMEISAQPIVREKEIIREKEVIVKVKCPYCGKLYNEVMDICPHCGGKR